MTNRISFRKEKSSVVVLSDGVPYFTAYAPLVKKYGVADGALLTAEELEAFKTACLSSEYAQKADWLFAKRDYSAGQLVKKLGGEREIAGAVVAELVEKGVVDDEKYALRRAEKLLFERLYSPGKTVFTLMSEGIGRELAEAAVEELGYDQTAALEKLIRKRYARLLFSGAETDRSKMTAALLRLGFEYGHIREAAANLEDEGG